MLQAGNPFCCAVPDGNAPIKPTTLSMNTLSLAPQTGRIIEALSLLPQRHGNAMTTDITEIMKKEGSFII